MMKKNHTARIIMTNETKFTKKKPTLLYVMYVTTLTYFFNIQKYIQQDGVY